MADDKKKEEIPILKEHEELQKIIRKYSAEKGKQEIVEAPEMQFVTREFKEFQKGYFTSQNPQTFFEKACRFSSGILKVGIKKEDEDRLSDVLYYTGLVIRPAEVISLSIFAFVFFMIVSAGLFFAFGGFQYALITLIVGVIALFGIQKYPEYLQRVTTVETLNSMPLAIIYMVIYMRSSPTLEGAVRFTAEHLPGSLGRDLKKLVWDLENGAYTSMDQALATYASKWQAKNQNFSTAIELIRNSMRIPNENERMKTLDEAARVMLRGNLEMMQNFARGLKMPIVILYMLGIVLPVMGLVIAPVITTLMGSGLSINALIAVYNILLPIIIYVMLKIVLSKRPGGFSRPDIEGYPGLPAAGRYLISTKSGKEYQIPLSVISILAFILISIPGILMLLNPPAKAGFDLGRVLQSLTIVIGTSIAIIIYTVGSSVQKLKVRAEMEELETGLDAALYQLGERISMGTPVESAIANTSSEIKSGTIRAFFLRLSMSMKNLGMPLEQALFDPENGALRYYPSKTLRTIMEVLVESTKKGLGQAAVSMKTIGKFLENLRTVKATIESLIGSTITTMKFQAQFLSSFISGIIISLDILLFKILTELGTRVESISLPQDVSAGSVTGLFKSSMFNVASVVPAENMQIVVGIYMIEATVLLSIMINGVMNGKDDIYKNYTIGTNLIASLSVYVFALIFGILLFSGFKVSPV